MSNINLFPELDNEEIQEKEYNNGHNEYKEEDLIVFGYSCKLFRDDFSAKAIDRGQSLIPWNGDETVMIDRCAKNEFLFSLFSFFYLIKNKTFRRDFYFKIETCKYW
jgi:alternative splicing regulator